MSGPHGGNAIRGPEGVTPGELPAGAVVGEYRVTRKIADGGMATVYAGIHPLIHKKVAIKVMRPVDHGDPHAVERFIGEARTVNQIAHPNIVDVFAFGLLPDGRCYLVMDWLDGETLAARVRRGRVPFEEGLDIVAQIVEALAAAHDNGIIHRDIKPENIYLVRVRRHRRVAAKLLDFGISTLLVDERPADSTGQRHFFGTPRYTSPEQAAGAVGDVRSDIYALAVTAFELFVGRPPFEGDRASELLRQHLSEIPPAPSTIWPEIPLHLERLLVQMLDKAPEGRPTLGEVAARIAELRSSVAEPAAGEDPTELNALPRRRLGWLMTLALVGGLGGAGATAWTHRDRVRALVASAADVEELAAPVSAQPAPAPQPQAEPEPLPSPTTAASDPVAPAAAAAGRLKVDVDVPSLIRVDGRVVARGRRAALEVAPETGHVLVVSAPRRGTYRERVVVDAGSTVELAVRLGAARPSANHRRLPEVAPAAPPPADAPAPRPGDPNYMMNPFGR